MNDELELPIEFDGFTEKLLVHHLGGNLYRAEESSVLGVVQWKDEFEVERIEERYRLVRITRRSGMQTSSFMIPLVVAESAELKLLLEKVVAAGGNGERIFGGCLLIHVPENSKLDVGKELEQVFALVRERQSPDSLKNKFRRFRQRVLNHVKLF